MDNGVLIGLSNRLSGDVLVRDAGQATGLCTLHSVNGEMPTPRAKWVLGSTLLSRLEWVAQWDKSPGHAAARMRTWFEGDAETGDILVQQEGRLGTNGLAGVSWGIAFVPDDLDVFVPGCSGQRFSADAPAQRRIFDYPMMWEAPFVLIQGRRGGVIVWAEDASCRFKTLVLDHSQRLFKLQFESRNTAPFQDKQEIASSRWRIRAYAGNWQTGAAIYREWAKRRFGLVPLAQKSPAWAREIGLVITMQLDEPLLADLASRCDPARTLLYLPGWRRDGYDRNYPDYTATPALKPFIAEAHRLGFRVMLHVNYFGCDPKNPAYDSVKQWQVRDPFSGELQWWEWPAQPPIKFAYINPASRAWRELFVQRMKDVVAATGADALHLDQTLCIYNDKNGVIDGLNCIEGSLALHRQLREALPEVALSGEGLNEITCQYEHFAQRHIWSMDHVHHTWDDRQVAMCHAISSAIVAPYTRIYGYLGMANPRDATLFLTWRRAYEHFGTLPTYCWPDKGQLNSRPVMDLLAQGRFFQEHHPEPDFDTPWHRDDLFLYRLSDGGRARFHRDQGVAFEAELNGKAPEVLARRIEGVTEAKLAGSIPGWPAYDAEKIIGLNPAAAYEWSPQPRDPSAPHLSALPADFILACAAVDTRFARFKIVRSPTAEARNNITLWDYTGSVTGGVRLADGSLRSYGGLEFIDEETAGTAHPDGDGLFIHPPWKTLEATPGRNVAFLDYPLTLPDVASVRFTSGVELKPGAEGKSDGVTFRVEATCGGQQRSRTVHHAAEAPAKLELDLSAWRGKSIVLHLEADPGPAGSPTYDWGRFVRPQIVAKSNSTPVPQSVRLAAFAPPDKVLAGEGTLAIARSVPKAGEAAELVATCRLPNTLIVPIAAPDPAELPLNLLRSAFSSHLVLADGLERTGYGNFGAKVLEVRSGGQSRPALSLRPLFAGSALADWWLRLPPLPARLVTAIGVGDGSGAREVGFAVEVNGRRVFHKAITPAAGWVPVEVSLAEWQGQPVVLTFVTEALPGGQSAPAAWAGPRLEAAR